MKKYLLNSLKIILPLAIGVYLLWYFYDGMQAPIIDEQGDTLTKTSWDIFKETLGKVNYFWIVLSLILSFSTLLSRSARHKYLLEPIGYKAKFWHRYHALMIGYVVNYLIPRAGEASRASMLYRSDKIPFSKTLGTIIAERVFDLVMLGLVVLFAFILSFDDLIAIKDQLMAPKVNDAGELVGFQWKHLVYAVLGVGFLAFLFLWFKVEKFRNKFKTFVKDIITGVFSIFKSKNPIPFIGHTLFIWINYVLFFGICFLALPETLDFPLGGILLGFIAGTLGIMFTNGGIGAYPVLVGLVVTYFLKDTLGAGEAKGLGMALGMIIWSSQTLMMIILGLVSLALLPNNYKNEEDEQVQSVTK